MFTTDINTMVTRIFWGTTLLAALVINAALLTHLVP